MHVFWSPSPPPVTPLAPGPACPDCSAPPSRPASAPAGRGDGGRNPALRLGGQSYSRDDLILSPEERQEGKDPSRWVVMAREPWELGALADSAQWRRLGGEPGVPAWTDDFSNLWRVIRWEAG